MNIRKDPEYLALGICSAMVIVFLILTIVSVETINPEIALFWVMHQEVKSYIDLFNQYVNYEGGWYRPTAFFLYLKIVTSVSSWHDIKIFQFFTLFLHFLNAYLITLLAREIFDSSIKERLLLFILVATNPLSYWAMYEANGFDYLYQIFSTAFMILIMLHLNKDFISKRSSLDLWISGFVIVFLFALALTSKEQSISVAIIAIYLLFHYRKKLPMEKTGFRMLLIIVAISVAALSAAWFYYIAFNITPRTGAYRTGFDVEQTLGNMNRLIQWALRINFVKIEDYTDVRNDIGSNVVSLFLIFFLIYYIQRTYIHRDFIEKNKIQLLLIIALIYASFPVVFGGAPWHFVIVSNLMAMLIARSVIYVLPKHPGYGFFNALFYLMLGVSILITAVAGIKSERDISRAVIVRVVPSLLSLTKNISTEIKQIYYSTGDFGDNLWPFTEGAVFAYSFLDPEIKAVPLPPGEKCGSRPYAPPEQSLCFDFNGQKPSSLFELVK